MAVHEFLLAIELSGPVPSRDMLSDLVRQALERSGCACADLAAIVDGLQSAVGRCASGGEVACELRFRAHAGMLAIELTASGGQIWQTVRSTT